MQKDTETQEIQKLKKVVSQQGNQILTLRQQFKMLQNTVQELNNDIQRMRTNDIQRMRTKLG